jgi:hypothetical protein
MKDHFKLLEEIIKIKHELSVLKKRKKKKKALVRKKSKSKHQYKISTKHLTNAVQPAQQPIMVNPYYHEQLKHDAKNYLIPTKKEDENQLVVVVPPKKVKRPPTPKKIVYVKSPLKKRMTQAFQYTKAQLSKLSLKDLRAMIKLRLPDVTDAQLKLINSKNKVSMIKKFVDVIKEDEQDGGESVDDDDLNYAHIHPKKSQTYNSPFDDDNFGVNPSAFASVSSYDSPTFADQHASTEPLTPQKYSSSSYIPEQKLSSSDTSSLHQKESPSSLQLSQPLFTDQTASSSSGEYSPQFIDDHASTSSHPFMTATVPTPPQPKKSKRIAATADKISIPRTSTRLPKKTTQDTSFTKPLDITKSKKGKK